MFSVMLASVSRGISLVGVSLKNVLYFLLFAAVILFLFFIPEILKFNWASYFGFDLKRQAVQTAQVLRSPLDDVIQRINAGQYSAKAKPATAPVAEAKPALAPFNPQMRITKLDIIKLPNQGNPAERPVTVLQVYGAITGKDIKRVALFHNGNLKQKIPISRANKEGLREFYITQQDAYGKFTFYVEDTQGRVYTKTYKFFPKIERFPKSRDTYVLKNTLDGLDPRIDRYFTIGEKIPGRQGGGKGYIEF